MVGLIGLTIFLSYIHIYNKAFYMKLNRLKQIIKEEFLQEIKVLSAGSYGIDSANGSIPLKADSSGKLKVGALGLKELVINDANLKTLLVSPFHMGFEGRDDEDYIDPDAADDETINAALQRGKILSKITFKHCPKLENLDCQEVGLIGNLDLSNCPNLKILFCHRNELTSLDLSNCTKLEWLLCLSNQLTSLDVSSCRSSLKKLDCEHNELTSLDLSNCAKLEEAECSHNELNSLDVSNCFNLETLGCYDNNLTVIDLSKTNITNLSRVDSEVNIIKNEAYLEAERELERERELYISLVTKYGYEKGYRIYARNLDKRIKHI